MNNDYNIVRVNGHYEVYINGKFFCSTDTVTEAVNEIEGREDHE